MGIKRSKVAEPQRDKWDYAVRIKHDLFSEERWKQTPEWDVILKQVEITRQASQMINFCLYPSKLFFTAIDLFEANLLVIDDLFYCLTGIRLIGAKLDSEEVKNTLGFWNMDCYKVLKQINKGLIQAKAPLVDALNWEPIRDVTRQVEKMYPGLTHMISPLSYDTLLDEKRRACLYANAHYEPGQIDKEALATQIVHILRMAEGYSFFFGCLYVETIGFPRLLTLFRQSEKAQKEYIEPWRKDFGGTRDNLIAKMDKDPKLGPWVNRYDHLSTGMSVCRQLFYDGWTNKPINEEECYNTGNWISILTVAAILQEYDELHGIHPAETKPKVENEGRLSFLIHVAKTNEEAQEIDNELKRLAQFPSVAEICAHLKVMAKEKKIMLPEAKKAYNEMVRLGMSTGRGFSEKTFVNNYGRPKI